LRVGWNCPRLVVRLSFGQNTWVCAAAGDQSCGALVVTSNTADAGNPTDRMPPSMVPSASAAADSETGLETRPQSLLTGRIQTAPNCSLALKGEVCLSAAKRAIKRPRTPTKVCRRTLARRSELTMLQRSRNDKITSELFLQRPDAATYHAGSCPGISDGRAEQILRHPVLQIHETKQDPGLLIASAQRRILDSRTITT
jgi:hypothetical protein